MNDPEWSDFKILIALARGGSVAGAARVLAVDHSTVSRRLAALEDCVGAPLIVRGGRELSWTAEGRTLLSAAEAVESVITEATRSVRFAQHEIEGPVRVSCAPGVSAALARILPAVQEKYPLLALELSAENRTVDLAKGEAEIALRMFKPTDPGLVCRKAFEMGWGLYASKTYVAEHGAPTSVEALSQHRLVLYTDALLRASGPRWLEDNRGSARAFGRVDNTEVAAQVIASGGGIGVLPCFIAATRPELACVFDDPVAFATCWIVYHEAKRDTARVRAAIDALVTFFEANEHMFSRPSVRA